MIRELLPHRHVQRVADFRTIESHHGDVIGRAFEEDFAHTFTSRFPMFSPLSRPMNARGAFSSPSTMSSR